ncbi:adenylate/guanylate cyclase domain-containing protein [Bradyrhizobium sp. WYCCWR 12699]|uniref:adenylate/guanylate cyclase domain-containing protein n=1 Tax=Bradyrhizobium sp. WYCCWR 12699 TaxID=3064203 RepID=UPI0028A4C807|nr:adenylate/guanylate cyclase domain-containing protein [Bradyrhizobium sp. WYCCWR 12699]MDT4738603.1 adenylate/guanylate cyclase domain-containing protein [Bradyrhizobium sp. WYCCWR 12699]
MAQDRRVERRLAAILAADVAGYSRLMHHDEEATHAKLTVILADAVYPAIAEHGGRVVKNTGDGFLAEFPSAVDALRAAVLFQSLIKDLTANEVEEVRIAFRVGINISDVIVEPHDIFGDGVNIAARLESLAQPGGICISSSAYDYVRGKVSVDFIDLGERTLKNIDRAVRPYAVIWGDLSTSSRARPAFEPASSPPRLSIVVLPFANLGGGPEQEYFVDGVTEALTTDLSRISGAFVIGRHTAFTYKGTTIDVKRIGRELNVRYVLEGSVQRSGNRIRVNTQLIDSESSSHVWADRFDKSLVDMFDMQDEIVARLASALNAELIAAEARRAQRSVDPDAMDLYFQGVAIANRGTTPEHLTQARGFFESALVKDPGCIDALVGCAGLDEAAVAALLTDDPASRLEMAEATINEVLSLAPEHALAHLRLGVLQVLTNRVSEGIAECQRALTLDRNLAHAYAWIGLAKVYIGRAGETEADVQEALRLSPRDSRSYIWLMIVGMAKFHLGLYGEAVVCLRRSIEANRNHPLAHFWLAAALAWLGAIQEAKRAARAGLALNSSFSIRRVRSHLPSDNPIYLAGRARLYEGLRLAGVPEQ